MLHYPYVYEDPMTKSKQEARGPHLEPGLGLSGEHLEAGYAKVSSRAHHALITCDGSNGFIT